MVKILKILNNLLMFVLIILTLEVIVTFVLEIFYFPNILIFKFLIAGLFLILVAAYLRDYVDIEILRKQLEKDEEELFKKILGRCNDNENTK